MSECKKDKNGNSVYNLNYYEGETEKTLTKEDAVKLLEFKNKHLLNLTYVEPYSLQYIDFGENPEYSLSDIENVSEYLEKRGV